MSVVWLAQYIEPYEGTGTYGAFADAQAAMKALDKQYPLNRKVWPRAKAWKKTSSNFWYRVDGYAVTPYVLGALE